MFDRKKYVIFDYCIPIIFTEAHTHNQFQYMGNITSAGFANIQAAKDGSLSVCCFGKSVSLNIDSDPEKDERIIKNF